MKKLVRASIALLLLSFGVFALSGTPSYDTVWTYYSDATLTTVVGQKFEMCSGTWRTGTTSAYYDIWIGESCSNGAACPPYAERQECGNCNDGIDNDGDGHVDYNGGEWWQEPDPSCFW